MKPEQNISAIVFDVGRVLIDFSYAEFFNWLTAHGARLNGIEDFVRRTELHAYEKGHIDDDTFLANLNQLLTQPVDRHGLVERWLDLFVPIDDMLQLARQLMQHYRVYLLSNTSALHWQHVVPRFRLNEYSHGLLASYEVGVMKPDAAIFRAAEQQFKLSPVNTVFIDDIADNTLGAEQCGWHGIHHTNSLETRRKLARLGVIL